MKAWPVIIVILVAVATVGTAIYYTSELSIMRTPSLCRDSNNISGHIYNPARLQVFKDCVTVSGIVNSVITEDDGDYHVWFHVDSQYANMPNSVNNDYRQGDLLAEIICATTVNQQDAVLACESYNNQIPLPMMNQNITVTGPYVLDSTHGWMEIHPVYSLLVSYP
jgi:hypothetical protein